MMKAGYKLRSVWFPGLAALGTARPPPWRHEAGMKGLFPALWLVSPKGPRNQTSFPPAPDASPRLLFPTGALERPRPQRAYAFFRLEELWINCSLVASVFACADWISCQKTLTWTAFCGVFASPPPPLSVISASAFSRGLYVFRQHSSLFPNVSQF